MTHSVLTHFGACDGRFSDEQVFEVLREGEAGGQSTADLCAAHGITIPMYCVWKAKYRRLSLDDLRAVRRRADRRARLRLAGAVVGAIGLAVVGPGVLLVSGRDAPAAQAAQTPPVASSSDSAAVGPLPQPRPPAARVPVPDAATSAADATQRRPSPVAVRSPGSAPAAAPAVSSGSTGAATAPAPVAPPATGERYAVQVAAAQSPAEAQALVRRLGDAGHQAYVLSITVGTSEHFRVRVGPFESQREADERARTLARNGFPGAWVAR